MFNKVCKKCGMNWLVSDNEAKQCPHCEGDLTSVRVTNRDALRYKTDEELTEWLESVDFPWCNPEAVLWERCDRKECAQCCLEWLKREAEQ